MTRLILLAAAVALLATGGPATAAKQPGCAPTSFGCPGDPWPPGMEPVSSMAVLGISTAMGLLS